MKILWVSRHQTLPRQLAELERLFGTVEVTQDPKPFSSAEDIARRFQQGGYDDIVVVAPLSVLARLIDLGIRPLWSEMEAVTDRSQAEVTMQRRNGRVDLYRFSRFRRVTALRMEFEDF